MNALPAGHTFRSPRLPDAETIHQLVTDYLTNLLGRSPVSLSEVVESFTAATFDPEHDGWLVLDGTGHVVGYGFVLQGGDRRFVQLSVFSADPAVGGWLLDTGITRARDLGSENGQPEVTVSVGMFREDEALKELVSGRGFEFGTTFQQMRVDHPGPIAVPEPPTETRLRTAAYDDQTRRAAHAVMTAAFIGQDSATISPYDEWLADHENQSTFDWSQVTLVERDGLVLAACESTSAFVESDNCGYISHLGVLPEARGLGLASYLLRNAFATDAAAGLDGTMLHVDTNNPTPALSLYESVGMHQVQIADQWDLKLPT